MTAEGGGGGGYARSGLTFDVTQHILKVLIAEHIDSADTNHSDVLRCKPSVTPLVVLKLLFVRVR